MSTRPSLQGSPLRGPAPRPVWLGGVYGSEQIVSGAYGEGLLAVGGMELAACPVDVGEDAALADIQERGYLVGG